MFFFTSIDNLLIFISSCIVALESVHALGDLIQSLGVVIAGALIWWKVDSSEVGNLWQLADPIATFFFGLIVLYTTKSIFTKLLRIFLLGTTLNIESIVNDIEQLSFVSSAHDFHAFEVSSDLAVLIGHVVVDDDHHHQNDDISSLKINYTQYLQQIKIICLNHSTLKGWLR